MSSNGSRVTVRPARGGIVITIENNEIVTWCPLTQEETLIMTGDMLVAAGVRQAAFNGSELRAV